MQEEEEELRVEGDKERSYYGFEQKRQIGNRLAEQLAFPVVQPNAQARKCVLQQRPRPAAAGEGKGLMMRGGAGILKDPNPATLARRLGRSSHKWSRRGGSTI